MEIRYVNANDDLFEKSNIYEESWKFAYKGVIPQDYLNGIPSGHWANSVNKDGMNNLLLIENDKKFGTACFCKSRWKRIKGSNVFSIWINSSLWGSSAW